MRTTDDTTALQDLQDRVKAWHRAKYRAAPIERIGLKLAEEAGEVARAIDRIIHTDDDKALAVWNENLDEEIGDVGMVLLVLCIYRGKDLEELLLARAEEVMAR